MTTAARPSVDRMLPALLLLLTVFGPISMDLYLPALPALTAELSAATSVAQLTVTACLVGLAAGQLIAGPVSDRYGRRGILLVGIVAYVLTSMLCAISPTIELLVAARFVQGLAGGVGIVIAQAAGRDAFSGGELIRFYARLTVVGGFAAIVGPLLGGLLNTIIDWRGLFVFLAMIGAAILSIVLVRFGETLPAEARTTGGMGRTVSYYRTLLRDRVFVGAVLNQGLMYAALFAYLSGATFVLQDIYGLSPLGYALAFGANSAGFMVFGHLAGRFSERGHVHAALAIGVGTAAVGALGLLAAGIVPMPLWVVLASLFALAAGVSISSPPAATLALVGYPQIAGTASSLLGMVRFGFGGVAAPLVGVAGAMSILPLGVVTIVATLLAAIALLPVASARGRTVPESSPLPTSSTALPH
ncbi:multidrug effflux MFS transporter [Microbacterium sp. NPDC089320]|uniref:multidrug effflux MFS transporter n=1 Tax=Microbacterium sp. NPDC089320 TaxID=3155182 RepID=UPI00342D858B